MKKYSVVFLCLIFTLSTFRLSAQRKYYDAVSACLSGNVKTETSIGVTSSWNRDGSIAEGVVTRNQQMLPIKISLQNVYSTYSYDKENRLVVSYIYFGNSLMQKEEYKYGTDHDFLPVSIIITYSDGESVIQQFEYTKRDEHKNWTECNMTQTRRGKTTTRKMTRKITYWE